MIVQVTAVNFIGRRLALLTGRPALFLGEERHRPFFLNQEAIDFFRQLAGDFDAPGLEYPVMNQGITQTKIKQLFASSLQAGGDWRG
jgi:hypothetical protein